LRISNNDRLCLFSGIELEEVEKEILLQALKKHGWNQTHAAKHLNISHKTLIYRWRNSCWYHLRSRQFKSLERGLSLRPGIMVAALELAPLSTSLRDRPRYGLDCLHPGTKPGDCFAVFSQGAVWQEFHMQRIDVAKRRTK
jgi:hypothetical protein